MAAIKTVRIENFQSHEDSFFEFSEGLNVITGPSDQGKSAVLRAIKWLLYNEPRGLDFIKQGAAFAKVTIEMDNDIIITRERSKSKNRYMVTYTDGSSIILEGFGNEIPEEVLKAHGILKVKMDSDMNSSLNISEQLEGPFLLSETGSFRAKAIGRMSGLHIIDKALRESNLDLRREYQHLSEIKKIFDETLLRLEEFEYLPKMEEKIYASENLIKAIDSKLILLNALENLNKKYCSYLKDYNDVTKTLDKFSDLDKIQYFSGKSELRLNEFNNLERLMKSYNKILSETKVITSEKIDSSKLNEAEALLIKIKNTALFEEKLTIASVKLHTITKEIENIEKIKNRFPKIEDNEGFIKKLEFKLRIKEKLKELEEKYKVIVNNIAEGEKFIEDNKIAMLKLIEEYSVLLKNVGKCPVCYNEIDEVTLNSILEKAISD